MRGDGGLNVNDDLPTFDIHRAKKNLLKKKSIAVSIQVKALEKQRPAVGVSRTRSRLRRIAADEMEWYDDLPTFDTLRAKKTSQAWLYSMQAKTLGR